MTRMGVCGLLVLVTAGCSSPSSSSPDEPQWQYDQADMEGTVLGTWTGTFTPDSGTPSALTLTIRSHVDPARQLACGSRTFENDGATPGLDLRCVDMSVLPVSATLTIGDDAGPYELDGQFTVMGTTLNWAELQLSPQSSESGSFWARWDNAVWSHCELGMTGSSGSCTLDERAESE